MQTRPTEEVEKPYLFQVIIQEHLQTLMTLEKWPLFLILCQILKKVYHVKVLDLLHHLKKINYVDFLVPFEILK